MAATIGFQQGEQQCIDGDVSPERRLTLIAAFFSYFPGITPRKAPQTRLRREGMTAVARSAAVRARGGYKWCWWWWCCRPWWPPFLAAS